MAYAILTKPDPIPTPPSMVTLTMTLLEAQTLKQITMNTGGDPDYSARKHTDAINEALYKAGVRSAKHPTKDTLSITFADEGAGALSRSGLPSSSTL